MDDGEEITEGKSHAESGSKYIDADEVQEKGAIYLSDLYNGMTKHHNCLCSARAILWNSEIRDTIT